MNEIILLVLVTIYIANAQQITQIDNNELLFDKRVTVHLHPYWTGISLLGSVSEREAFGFLYSTIEVPLSISNSLIIKPSLWMPEGKLNRIGSDIGLRYYPSEKGKGFYISGTAGLFYYPHPIKIYLFSSKRTTSEKIWCDVMGYMGYSWKFKNDMRMFIDMGVGHHFENPSIQTNFIPDMNFGIGFPIGKIEK